MRSRRYVRPPFSVTQLLSQCSAVLCALGDLCVETTRKLRRTRFHGMHELKYFDVAAMPRRCLPPSLFFSASICVICGLPLLPAVVTFSFAARRSPALRFAVLSSPQSPSHPVTQSPSHQFVLRISSFSPLSPPFFFSRKWTPKRGKKPQKTAKNCKKVSIRACPSCHFLPVRRIPGRPRPGRRPPQNRPKIPPRLAPKSYPQSPVDVSRTPAARRRARLRSTFRPKCRASMRSPGAPGSCGKAPRSRS